MSVVQTSGQCPACGGSAVVSMTVPPLVCCNGCGHVSHVPAPPKPRRIRVLSSPDMDHGPELGEAGA